jgi:hypothetical protein
VVQPTLEAPLEKKSGVRFGPPGAKSMVYFIDDMNMPFVDKYDTQSAIEIVRQYVDYGGWYDKIKIVLKDIVNCQLVGAMNPTAGSFQITPRMQRHFVTYGIVVRSQCNSLRSPCPATPFRCCRTELYCVTPCACERVFLAKLQHETLVQDSAITHGWCADAGSRHRALDLPPDDQRAPASV